MNGKQPGFTINCHYALTNNTNGQQMLKHRSGFNYFGSDMTVN